MIDDSQLRLYVFLLIFILMVSMEVLLPYRPQLQKRQQRWPTNLGLMLLNIISIKLLGPITAVTAADLTTDNNWGLLNLFPFTLPLWAEIILGIILLDMAIYWQHVASHRIPLLWRYHQIHHADREIDVTTGVRFHPIEAVLSMLYKCLIILLAGPTTIAVVIFEILLNGSAMFNHSNIKLPNFMDRFLRCVIVTPDFHRVHHSVIPQETNSNYGFFLSCWDRLFGSYIAQPSAGHHDMSIGLNQYQSSEPASFLWCLHKPFQFSSARSISNKLKR